jgi:threonine dehydrogenase-like Zn-dependent dehydrogenase
MKAIYASAPDDYRLVERPKPTPAADQALVRVVRASLCHTDVIIRDGVAGHTRYPFIPGHEFAGVVEECGPEVKHIQPGDRVAVHTIYACGQCPSCHRGDTIFCEHRDELGSSADGGFAEYCAVESRFLFKLPAHVSLAEGALLEPLANAVSAVRHANVRMGEKAVVSGPGPIGVLVLQVARLFNPAHLVLVGTREQRLALADRFGATSRVNIRSGGAQDQLRAILGKGGADVVLDCAGTRSALQLALDIIGPRGRIAIEGVHGIDEMLPISPYYLMAQAVSLIGVCGWVTADYAQALALVSNRLVDVRSLITHTYPLEEWEAAFDMITEHKDEAIKVQFSFQ